MQQAGIRASVQLGNVQGYVTGNRGVPVKNRHHDRNSQGGIREAHGLILPIYCIGKAYQDRLEGCETAMLMRIGGKDAEGIDSRWIEVKNPATGEQIDRVPAGTKEDVSCAAEAADAAFYLWAKKSMRTGG